MPVQTASVPVPAQRIASKSPNMSRAQNSREHTLATVLTSPANPAQIHEIIRFQPYRALNNASMLWDNMLSATARVTTAESTML